MVIQAKSLIKQRFGRALDSYDQQAIIQQAVNRHLLDLLLKHQSNFQSVLEIGCGTGDLSFLLQQHCQANYWLFNDLCDVSAQLAQRSLPQPYQFICADGELMDFTQSFDLIASASTVQWFHQPQQFIERCKSCLQKEGLLSIATFTPENLTEIRQLTHIGLTYPSLEDWRIWLEPAFHLLEFEHTTLPLYFDSAFHVLTHLKHSGVTATNNTTWTKGRLQQFCREYEQRFSDKHNKVRLSYTPLFILAKYKGA